MWCYNENMITKKDLKYLKIAEAMSSHSDYPRVKIGACLVYKGNVVGLGYNETKSHPIQKKYNKLLPYEVKNPFLHAEISAIIHSSRTKGATLYVFRRGRDGLIKNCRPCASCRGYIKDSEIKKVIYTTEFGVEEINI